MIGSKFSPKSSIFCTVVFSDSDVHIHSGAHRLGTLQRYIVKTMNA